MLVFQLLHQSEDERVLVGLRRQSCGVPMGVGELFIGMRGDGTSHARAGGSVHGSFLSLSCAAGGAHTTEQDYASKCR